MSDSERRALARAAGDGDLGAARKLVALLSREQVVDPLEHEFMTMAREYAAAKKCSVTKGMSFIAKTRPELHDAFIAASPRVDLNTRRVRS